MTAATLTRAAERLHKSALYADVLAEVQHTRGYVWSRELREESLIVGQVDARPLIVVVKLPRRAVPDATLALIVDCVRHGGIGFVVHQPGEFERLRVWAGK